MPDAANARVYSDGAIMRGGDSASTPTSATSTVTGYTDFGYATEDGVTYTPSTGGDSETIRAWQNRAVLRVIRTPSDDVPTYQFTIAETTPEVIEAVKNSEFVGDAIEDKSHLERTHEDWIIEYIDHDAGEIVRDWLPYGIISEVAEVTINSTGVTGYQFTVAADPDPDTGITVKSWHEAVSGS